MTENNKIVKGQLWVEIIKYLAPLIFSMLIQHSYQTADALIVGRFAGANTLGAIDSTYGFTKLLINSTISLTAAAAVIIARFYGSGDYGKVKSLIKGMVSFVLIIGVTVSVFGFVYAEIICHIMNVPQNMLKEASIYASIYLSGALFMMLYNSAGSVLKSLGESKFPAVVLVISSIMNVLLDVVFIMGFQLGVAGAAIATVISQIISAVLVSIKLFKVYRGLLAANTSDYYILDSIKELLSFGFPSAVQSVLFSFSNIYLQSAINSCGATVVSGWAVCGKIDFIIWIIADGLSITASTFVAQNLGAGEAERAFKSQRIVIGIYVTITLVLSGIMYIFTPFLSKIFVKDYLVISVSAMLMRLIAPFYVTSIGAELFSGILRGHGKTVRPTVLTLIGTVGGRVLWISACSLLGFEDIRAIIMAYPFSWTLTTLLFISLSPIHFHCNQMQ